MAVTNSSWLLVWIPTKESEQKLLVQSSNTRDEQEIVDTSKNLSYSTRNSVSDEKDSGKARQKVDRAESFRLSPREQLTVNSSSVEFFGSSCLEETLNDVLAILKVDHCTFSTSPDKSKILAMFMLPSNQVELGLVCLQKHGIGNNHYTSVSVVPSAIHLQKLPKKPPPTEKRGETGSGSSSSADTGKLEQRINKFYESVKSRMLVAEVVERIRAGGKFTFDFLMLLILAGCIAFMGLIENSSVVLVASMLVSPLMGPILAGIFGSVIQDRKLRWQGIRNEAIALFLCILVGLILGFIMCPWIDTYGITQWPTQEMLSRGFFRSLYVGVLIAVPSGAGVALSVLGGNAGSLVGVAISASLLPPAVNCGLFWAIAIVALCSEDKNFLIGYALEGQTNDTSIPIYETQYSNDLAIEASVLGLVSLTLTLVNILCIIVTGVGILKLKEVTPEKIPQSMSTFWKRDVKAHRDYYQTFKKQHSKQDTLLREAREVLGIGKKEGLDGSFLQAVFENASYENSKINIKEWVASPPVSPPDLLQSPLPPIPGSLLEPVTPEFSFASNLNTISESVSTFLRNQADLIRLRRHLSDTGEISASTTTDDINQGSVIRNRSYTSALDNLGGSDPTS